VGKKLKEVPTVSTLGARNNEAMVGSGQVCVWQECGVSFVFMRLAPTRLEDFSHLIYFLRNSINAVFSVRFEKIML
jgi:hypothetical protein